jgi:hypothetical protein
MPGLCAGHFYCVRQAGFPAKIYIVYIESLDGGEIVRK